MIYNSLKVLCFIFLVVVSSCNVINPDEQVPAYLEINETSVSSNYITQGTSSSKIKDAWIYIDGQFIGAYQIPCKIPVLQEGPKNVFIGAGIYLNGIASTREAYPLYKFYNTSLTLKAGEISVIDTAKFAYFPAIEYVWYEDFEKDTSGGGISIDTSSSSLANLQIESNEVFEGQRSLKLEVNSSQFVIDCNTVGDGYALTRGRDIYIELDYKCDQEFTVGLKGYNTAGERVIPVLKFNPSPFWNKIYINVSKYVNINSDLVKFKVYFNAALANGATNGVVYVDNVKLISN